MTKKTRYFVMASAAILTIGLAGGVVAYYGFSQRALFRPSAPAELRYVPSDVAVLAYANVREVMDSSLRRELQKLQGNDAQRGQREFRDQTGIDIEKDVDRVVAFLTPELNQREGSPRGLVLARGRFEQTRIEALLREHGGTAEQYQGKRILTVRPGAAQRDKEEKPPARATEAAREMALAFIQPGLVGVGSGPLVRRAIDLEQGGANVTRNDEFMKMVGEVQQGNAWAVGRFDALAKRMVPPSLSGQMPPLRVFSATGTVDGGVSGTLRAEAADDASAEQLRDVVRGFLALARLQAGSKMEAQAALKSLELGGTGKTVSLSFSFTPASLESLTPAAPRPGGPR